MPRPFFAIGCPQQEILQDKFIIAGSRRRTANQAFDFAVGGFRSGFDSDNLVERIAGGAPEKRISQEYGFLKSLGMASPPSRLYGVRFCASDQRQFSRNSSDGFTSMNSSSGSEIFSIVDVGSAVSCR